MPEQQSIIPDDLMEHALYHVLIPRLESYFELDPCPAIHAANELTHDLMAEVRRYLAWSGDAKDWGATEVER